MQSFQSVYASPASGQRHIQNPITRREQICRACWRWLTNLLVHSVCCYRIVWSVLFCSMMSGNQGCWVRSVHWLDFCVVPLSIIRHVWWNAECFILSWPGFPKQQCWYHTGHNRRAHCRGCERFPSVSSWLTDKLADIAYVITLYRTV